MKYRLYAALLLLWSLLLLLHISSAAVILPEIQKRYESLPASFGAVFSEDREYDAVMILPPNFEDNPDLCGGRNDIRREEHNHNRQHGPKDRRMDMFQNLSSVAVVEVPVALLVKRGNCAFADKALAAMNLDLGIIPSKEDSNILFMPVVKYMIVYNLVVVEDLIEMSSPSAARFSSLPIGMIFINNDSGMDLYERIVCAQNQTKNSESRESTFMISEAIQSNWTSWVAEKGYGLHVQLDVSIPERFKMYEKKGRWIRNCRWPHNGICRTGPEHVRIFYQVLILTFVLAVGGRILWIWCVLVPREMRMRAMMGDDAPVGIRERIEFLFVSQRQADDDSVALLTKDDVDALPKIIHGEPNGGAIGMHVNTNADDGDIVDKVENVENDAGSVLTCTFYDEENSVHDKENKVAESDVNSANALIGEANQRREDVGSFRMDIREGADDGDIENQAETTYEACSDLPSSAEVEEKSVEDDMDDIVSNQCIQRDSETQVEPLSSNIEEKANERQEEVDSRKCHYYNQSSCSVCLDEYERGETLRVLPCGHSFHYDCILPWLTERQGGCPMCKRPALKQEGRRRA